MYYCQFKNHEYALLVANGQMVSNDLMKYLSENAKYILAADGGAEKLYKYEILPDAILGDLDSINNEQLERFRKNNVEIISRKSQEKNDLEKSILYLINHGFSKIIITSIHGNRDDHNYAVYQMLKKYSKKVEILIFTDYSEIFMLKPGDYQIKTEKNFLFSLFGFGRAFGITTKGLKYPLENENLFESSRGVSNLSIDKFVNIKFDKGNLLIFRNLRIDG